MPAPTKSPQPFPDLQPGDVLLYGGSGFVDRAIQFRTWSDVSHIEIFAWNVQSVASRNGIGVGKYPFRADGLRYVLRAPAMTLGAFSKGMEWFQSVNGLPYGWGDLARFYLINIPTKGLICSQFGALLFNACGLPLFSPDYPAGEVCPSDFLVTNGLNVIWKYQ